MEPVDLVPSGYRFLPTAEELVVDYLANWVAGAPLPARAVAFADVYGTEPWNLLGSGRQEGFFFAERKPKSSGGSRVDRKAGTGSWALNKKQEAVKSIVGGREMVVGRKSYLGEFSVTAEAISGGSLRNREESSALSAVSVTAVSGGSCVGQKRNREESSTLSAVSVTEAISGALQLDVSPPPTAVVVQHPSSLPPAGVPPGSPSSTHVGGDQLGITTEELEAFLASSSSSVDVGGEQNCTGGDAFFTTEVEASPFDLLSMPSLEQIRAFLISDDTFDLAAAGM
ncbi:hypothetical protein MUK42_07865 [Musa troglodytarum]|uniref:NAC domain-containing protein n=1 Tax=Musa troglodytarum TaxID=320322 RepID=A0A9E7H4N5_9LILI|nr:hypothetical protein MUK42_07865 [Musa troglodytarum]